MSISVEKLHRYIFFILLFFLPLNLAKHYVTKDAYVSGILVDYLVPTIYITDILVCLVIALFFIDLLFGGMRLRLSKRAKLIIFTLACFLALNLLNVSNYISFIKWLKLLEFSLLFLYVALVFKPRSDFSGVVIVLSCSVLFQSALGIVQWFSRGSLFDNYLMFGEQPYSYLSPAIARESFLGVVTIPPYGTFPHPNVLGGFLAVSLVMIAYYFLRVRKNPFLLLAFAAGFITLVLTQSYSAYFALAFGVFLIFFPQRVQRKAVALGALFVVLVSLALIPLSYSSLGDSSPSIYRRKDLITASINMITEHPLKGVGLNQFPVRLYDFGGVRGLVKFVQPVHNIGFLMASEAGLFSFLLFLLFLGSVFAISLSQSSFILPLISFVQVLWLGSLDHYLFTIQQGYLLFWLTLGMVLSTIVLHVQTQNPAQN